MTMDDPKRSEEHRDEEELELDEQSVSDMDVPEQEADQAKGGMMAEERPSTSVGCRPTRSGSCF